jgi:hypothetical protein
MLTLSVEADSAAANPPARVLVIGRSETVLSGVVTILRDKGYAAGATNEFDRTLDLFDVGQLDLVVFGGMVPRQPSPARQARSGRPATGTGPVRHCD